MNWSLLLPELVLASLGVAVLCADLWVGRSKSLVLGLVSLVGLAAALISVSVLVGQQTELVGNMMTVDGFALFFKILFLAIAALIVLLSVEYVSVKGVAAGEFYGLVLFAVLGMIVMASSRDLIMIYLGLETSSIASYVLAGMIRNDPKSNEASIKYFLTGAVASALVLFGMSLVYGLSGTTHLTEIANALEGGSVSPAVWAALMFLVVGFGFKIAAVPFHMWAPDAYEGAPTPVTAFFSVGPKAAAFAAMLRIFGEGFGLLQDEWSLIFAVLAVVTMTVANVTALVQTNIKRMLAYSSIAHAGYMLAGLTVASQRGFTAVVYYLAAYAVMNIGAFAVVILLNNQGVGDDIKDYSGLSQRSPGYAWALVVCFLSLIGIPPTAGFFGKFYVFASLVEGGLAWLAIAIVINSAISVGYYYAVVRNMFLNPPLEESPVKPSWGIQLGTLLAVIGVLVLGLAFEPFLGWASVAAALVR